MRICMYTETALPKIGGQEMVVDALAREFLNLGHEVTVLAQKPRRRIPVDDSVFPYPIVRHPPFISTRHLVGWYRYFILKLLAKRRFDVFHAHSIYPGAYMASLSRDRIDMPLVITSHGGDVRANNPRFRKSGLLERHQIGTQAGDGLISISDFTTDGFLRLGAEKQRIHAIPNGVHLDAYQKPIARPTDVDPGIQPRNYVLFLGRLSRRKGVDLALQALANFPSRGGIELVVAGGGDEFEPLRRQAAELGLGDRVRFVGPVFGEMKSYLLQNARALVVPSRGFEPFGLIVLEAFASGTPVIAGRLPGLGQLIDPGRTGWHFDAENIAQMSAEIHHVFETDEALGMAEAVRREAQRYSWTEIAKQHIALYAELIERRRGTDCRAAA